MKETVKNAKIKLENCGYDYSHYLSSGIYDLAIPLLDPEAKVQPTVEIL